MLTSNKKFAIIILTIILVLNIIVSKCYAVVQQTTDFYVNDYANIISNNTENYIINLNKELYSKTGAQVVVVTVTNLEGKSVEDYALETFRKYGIGSKEKNNGILFLVSKDDRKVRIEVGYGLEGRITDGKAGRILDNYVVPYFKQDNWEDGIKNGFDAIFKEVVEEYNIEIEGYTPIEDIENLEEEDDILYLSGIIVFIICNIIKLIFTNKKYILAPIVAIIATIIDCSVNGNFPITSYLMANGVGMIAGLIGLLNLLSMGIGIGGGRKRRRLFRRRRFFWRRRKQ